MYLYNEEGFLHNQDFLTFHHSSAPMRA